MSETERNLKVAKECAQTVSKSIDDYIDSYEFRGDGGDYTPNETEVLLITDAVIGLLEDDDFKAAYTSRILASQQAAHDAEIARLKAELTASDAALRESRANDMESMKQLSAANAACAMNVEALRDISRGQLQVPDFGKYAVRVASDAISASPQQVSEWEAKKLEPLRAQVNMMRQLLIKCDLAMDRPINERTRLHAELLPAIEETQATAEQFIAECEQRGAVKALDKVIKFGASEREARLVFANLQDRDNFLALVVGATSKKAG